MQESVHKRRVEQSHLPKDAPNILIILIDDAVPGLPSTYGGEINTPALTKVANEGISYNRFHTTAMCSPTRACILTGRNHTRVGCGQITEWSNDWDGFSGVIPKTSATVAEVLKDYGYSTAAFGKWHNTPADETSKMGPYDNWPTGYGFEYFYGFIAGETSQYEPNLVKNTTFIKPPKTPEEGYHLSEDLADNAIEWIHDHQALEPQKPFFIYWATGASHGPHQVPKNWADKYKGKFDDGWDKYRERVYERQKEIGWIPQDAQLTPRASTMASWESIPENEKPFQRKLMEVFAGFTEHADYNAGRVIDELDKMGIADNTLIFYIWGDNGSSAEGQQGIISELLAENQIPNKVEDHIKALNSLGGLDVLGSPKTDNMYNSAWGWAGSTPYKSTKLIAAHFGGTRNPMAIAWPKMIKPDKVPHSQFHHAIDIVPTIYDVLHITAPQFAVDCAVRRRINGTRIVRLIEPAHVGDHAQLTAHHFFQVTGSNLAFFECLLQIGLTKEFAVGHLQVQPGLDRGPNAVRGTPVGHHQTGKAPVVEPIFEQVRVLTSVGAIEPIVRAHYSHHVGLLDGRLESRQVQLVERAFVERHVNRRAFGFLIVGRKVFDSGDHVLTLHAANVGRGGARSQVRILAVTLEVAAAVGCAVNVDTGRQQHVLAVAARFATQCLPNPLGDARIERRGQRDARGKAC